MIDRSNEKQGHRRIIRTFSVGEGPAPPVNKRLALVFGRGKPVPYRFVRVEMLVRSHLDESIKYNLPLRFLNESPHFIFIAPDKLLGTSP